MVELMAVLIILGLLAAVVVRNFVGQVDKATGDHHQGQPAGNCTPPSINSTWTPADGRRRTRD